MSTTNTDYSWYWYIRRKGARGYLGLVDENGDDPSGAYEIEIIGREIPDAYTSDDDTFNMPAQYEYGVLKGVVAELLAMDAHADKKLIREYENEFERTVARAIHDQIAATGQPTIMKPFDLRDDD